jgi:hypothetical protein
MKTISAITSFNKHYYNLIGKDSVDTWVKYWPKNVELVVYAEEFTVPNIDTRIREISFTELPKEYAEFQSDPAIGGRVKTFAKKAYSIIHAFDNNTAERIIWMDADALTLKPVPFEFLESLCPDDTLLVYMRVWHNIVKEDPSSQRVPSAESGIFVVNTQHTEFQAFSQRYKQYYNERITAKLRRFYDGEVLGAVAQEFEGKCKIIDLCENFHKPFKTPLKHTTLGDYFYHLKSKHSKDQFAETSAIK